MHMYCFQCQETGQNDEVINHKGCTFQGMCGKTEETANMMDLLIYNLKGISILCDRLIKNNTEVDKEISLFIIKSFFSTITNACFDDEYIYSQVLIALEYKQKLLTQLTNKNIYIGDITLDNVRWFSNIQEDIRKKSYEVGVLSTENEDVRSLRELITYGIKGMSAYLYHANQIGFFDQSILNFLYEALSKITIEENINNLTALALETGKKAAETLILLDKANTTTFGDPEITKVTTRVGNRPGILVTGHDLKDLEELLIQSEGQGVDIYTHSEMLPAHYYPKFKKYSHLYGNYGSAWWEQNRDFELFNGPILVTTNCIIPIEEVNYGPRIFTTGAVRYPCIQNIDDQIINGEVKKDFSQLIEIAKNSKPPIEIETSNSEIIGGFAHSQVEKLLDAVLDLVSKGKIKKFIVMAGCDGRFSERKYYEDVADMLPKDTVILTAGCAKYRFIKKDLGTIDGVPRILDAGQCNDSFSLLYIALKLAEKLNVSVNELPIAYDISWYEQKAVAVLLALLAHNVQNIILGPTLPAFLSDNVVKVLVDTFKIRLITDPRSDLKVLLS